jgi:hypothetical protein
VEAVIRCNCSLWPDAMEILVNWCQVAVYVGLGLTYVYIQLG